MNVGKLAVALGVLAGLSMMTKKADATPQVMAGSNAAATGTPTGKTGQVVSFQGQPAVVNPSGYIIGTDVVNGKLRINEQAQVYNIQKANPNAQILATDNPLEKVYVNKWEISSAIGGIGVAGKDVQTVTATKTVVDVNRSFRAPVNEAEHTAARTSNIKSMIDSGAYSAAKAADLKKKYNL